MVAGGATIFLLLVGTAIGQNTTLISLDQAIDLALAHNHSLRATRTQILQNGAQEITANLRPNPTLGADTQFIPFFSPQDFSRDIQRPVQLAYRQALTTYLRPAERRPWSTCAFLSKFSPLRSLE